eukprot:Amastigsp_a510964_72.p2 type:complete len:156 gc:universal Amastigsp_a510964_72:425-892(+)
MGSRARNDEIWRRSRWSLATVPARSALRYDCTFSSRSVSDSIEFSSPWTCATTEESTSATDERCATWSTAMRSASPESMRYGTETKCVETEPPSNRISVSKMNTGSVRSRSSGLGSTRRSSGDSLRPSARSCAITAMSPAVGVALEVVEYQPRNS